MDTFYEERDRLERHLAKNAFYEQEALKREAEDAKKYKLFLIENIINFTNDRYAKEELARKPIKTLEFIHDNC